LPLKDSAANLPDGGGAKVPRSPGAVKSHQTAPQRHPTSVIRPTRPLSVAPMPLPHSLLRSLRKPRGFAAALVATLALGTALGGPVLALVDGAPRILPLKDILQYYIKHRQEVIRRRTRFELEKAEARLHIVEGLRRALDVIDEIIRIIRASPNPNAARDALMERFQFSQIQAQYILDMQLRALTGLEREKLEAEYRDLLQLIEMLRGILADREKVLNIIREDLRDIKKKFADPRRIS
jgi:DNA gyrase/topoisomerase IV subunit A